MTDSFEWTGKVGDTWAAEWSRTDRSFAELQAVLVDRIAALAPAQPLILDIGCGAGATALAVVDRLPDVECLGIDLSPSLVAVAKQRGADVSSCRFEVADATTWGDCNFRPSLLISRHGVMFFDDPVAAFSHLADAASPGARLVFSCFRSPAENEWATEIAALLPQAPAADPHAPGPFAFADEHRVSTILSAAGWREARAEAVDCRYVAGAGNDPVADAISYFGQIGPAARAMRALEPAAAKAFQSKLEAMLTKRLYGGEVAFDAAAWIWTAQR